MVWVKPEGAWKGDTVMEKQRLFKMSNTEQNMLVKALCDVRRERQPEESGILGNLIEKTAHAPGNKLYMNDDEFRWAALSLNGLRSAYLNAGRSSGGIDKVLFKLMSCKYRRVPVT